MKYIKKYEDISGIEKYFILKFDDEIIVGELINTKHNHTNNFISFYELCIYIKDKYIERDEPLFAKLKVDFFNEILEYTTDSLEDVKEKLHIMANITKYNL